MRRLGTSALAATSDHLSDRMERAMLLMVNQAMATPQVNDARRMFPGPILGSRDLIVMVLIGSRKTKR